MSEAVWLPCCAGRAVAFADIEVGAAARPPRIEARLRGWRSTATLVVAGPPARLVEAATGDRRAEGRRRARRPDLATATIPRRSFACRVMPWRSTGCGPST